MDINNFFDIYTGKKADINFNTLEYKKGKITWKTTNKFSITDSGEPLVFILLITLFIIFLGSAATTCVASILGYIIVTTLFVGLGILIHCILQGNCYKYLRRISLTFFITFYIFCSFGTFAGCVEHGIKNKHSVCYEGYAKAYKITKHVPKWFYKFNNF